jgi:hypothetical protein
MRRSAQAFEQVFGIGGAIAVGLGNVRLRLRGKLYTVNYSVVPRKWDKRQAGMESPPDDLKQVLSPNEQVLLYMKQKIYRPKISIDSVVITNMRVILRHPHAMNLKKDYTDYNYQDIANVELAKGVMRSTLKFTLRLGGEPLMLDSIPNDQAQKAYGLIRENLVRFQNPMAAASAGLLPMGQTAPTQQAAVGYCNKCGAPLSPGQMFCGKCGTPVSAAPSTVIEKEVVKVRCQYCGFLNDAGDSACKSCGAKI